MTQSVKRYYEFGPFRIDLKERVLMRGGQIVPLTPKVFDTLLAIVERRGELVSRQELIRAIWPETHVVEGNLNTNIFMLRRALGKDPSGQPYITTIPRRGYRFVASLREVSEKQDSPGGAAARTMAVLPFNLLSVGAGNAFLGLGMADALITRLSNLRHFVVRPTSAVRSYTSMEQEPLIVGRDLGVELVLEGSIQLAGDRIRVRVQLIDISNGASLWAEKFDEDFNDIFTVEDNISGRVADALTAYFPDSDVLADVNQIGNWPQPKFTTDLHGCDGSARINNPC
jgi:DNA-binding winged helix-turn-helix (wHTH) protein